MPFVNSQMGGLNLAFPDVCITPMVPVPIPIPYPNITMPMMGIPSQFKVLIMAMPAHNLMTIVPLSLGDFPGVLLNPMSGFVMGPTRHLLGSFKTFFGGMPVTKMLALSGHNGMSPGAFGTTLVPCQLKVMALT